MWYSRRANALRFEMACWNKTMWFHKDSANRTNYATNAFSQKISSTKIGRFENVWNHRNHQDGLVPAMGPKPKLHEGSNRFVTFSDHVRLNVESLSLQMHYYFASCFSSFHRICSLNFFNIICSVCSFSFFLKVPEANAHNLPQTCSVSAFLYWDFSNTISYYIDVACNIRQYILLSNVQHSLTQTVTNKKHISLTQNLVIMKDYMKLVVSSCAAVKMKSWKGKHFRNQVR